MAECEQGGGNCTGKCQCCHLLVGRQSHFQPQQSAMGCRKSNCLHQVSRRAVVSLQVGVNVVPRVALQLTPAVLTNCPIVRGRHLQAHCMNNPRGWLFACNVLVAASHLHVHWCMHACMHRQPAYVRPKKEVVRQSGVLTDGRALGCRCHLKSRGCPGCKFCCGGAKVAGVVLHVPARSGMSHSTVPDCHVQIHSKLTHRPVVN